MMVEGMIQARGECETTKHSYALKAIKNEDFSFMCCFIVVVILKIQNSLAKPIP